MHARLGMFRTKKVQTLLLALGLTASMPSVCQPTEGSQDSPASVRKRFESVDTVVVATLTGTRKIKVKGEVNDFEMPGEEDTFRVVRVYKGTAKVGDRFVLKTTLSGGGISAVNDPPWLYEASGRAAQRIQRTWLIYRNAGDNTQIRSSPYTSMLGPATGDLKLLEELKKQR